MKQQGKCIVGDPVSLDSYTAGWTSVSLHPATFYRRADEFEKSLQNSVGVYTEIDMGRSVILRFSNKDDATAFHRLHHNCI